MSCGRLFQERHILQMFIFIAIESTVALIDLKGLRLIKGRNTEVI